MFKGLEQRDLIETCTTEGHRTDYQSSYYLNLTPEGLGTWRMPKEVLGSRTTLLGSTLTIKKPGLRSCCTATVNSFSIPKLVTRHGTLLQKTKTKQLFLHPMGYSRKQPAVEGRWCLSHFYLLNLTQCI